VKVVGAGGEMEDAGERGGEFTAPGASNCFWHFPRAALRLRWAIFDRSLRDGEAIWPVCEAAPVGDGQINLTFMRLPCRQPPAQPGCRTRERNSARVSFCRKHPTIADVTVEEFCFSIPRIIMQRCRASITTPTPCGLIAS